MPKHGILTTFRLTYYNNPLFSLSSEPILLSLLDFAPWQSFLSFRSVTLTLSRFIISPFRFQPWFSRALQQFYWKLDRYWNQIWLILRKMQLYFFTRMTIHPVLRLFSNCPNQTCFPPTWRQFHFCKTTLSNDEELLICLYQ